MRYPEAVENQQGTRRGAAATIALAAIIVAIVVLETHWPSPLRFGGAKPDLMLLLVLYYAFSEGPSKAIGVGFIGGVLEDVFSAGPLGLHVFCKVLIGYVVGLIGTRLVTEHPIVMTIIVFLSTICEVALVVLLSFLYQDQVPVKFMFLHVGVPMAFYNSVLAPVCFYFADRSRARAVLGGTRGTEGVQPD